MKIILNLVTRNYLISALILTSFSLRKTRLAMTKMQPLFESTISTIDYEQSLFFLLSSSSRGKDIAKAGARKMGRDVSST